MNEVRTVAVFGEEDSGKSTFTRHGLRPGLSDLYGIPLGKSEVGAPAVSYVLFESPKKDDNGVEHVVQEGEDYRFVPAELKEMTNIIVKNRARGGATIVDIGKELKAMFMAELSARSGAESRLDLVVYVVRADASSMKPERVLSNIKELLSAGIEPGRLAVVFNRVTPGVSVAELLKGPWADMATAADYFGFRVISTALSQSFAVAGLRKMTNLTVESLAKGDIDYEKQAEAMYAAGQDELAEAVMGMVDLEEGSRAVSASFRAVFAELMGFETIVA